MNQHDRKVPWISRMKPYTERIKYHLKHWIQGQGETHCPLEITFDLGDFICNLLKVITHVFDQGFDGWDASGKWHKAYLRLFSTFS